MRKKDFFEESLEQSRIKAQIVSEYFWAWATSNVRKSPNSRVAYIDLFAGPGRYQDQTKSTPILILKQAIRNPDIHDLLVTVFNDPDHENKRSLERAINKIPNIDCLKHKPIVHNNEAGDNLVKRFTDTKFSPTLFFIDPWGYKGLSLRLINAVLRDWRCDCIFFFNYNHINMGLSNKQVDGHINALFGEKRANALRSMVIGQRSEERERVIMKGIRGALHDMGGKYILPFTFKNQTGSRTSHHLIFVSKNFRGYEVMKDIMAKQSSRTPEGVPTFEYNPASKRQPKFRPFRSKPITRLKHSLVQDFSGQELTMLEIYKRHSVDKPYIKRNYKKALQQLEAEGKILTRPPAKVRPTRKGIVTFADQVTVMFPQAGVP